MHEAINQYLESVKQLYYRGDATELTYRSSLQHLIESLCPGHIAINERKRVSVGAPDFVLFKKDENPNQTKMIADIPLGFVEAKDIQPGILDRPENQEQIKRYMELGNLVHTDGLTFRFYFDKELVKEISLGYVNEAKNIVTTLDDARELDYYFQKVVEDAGVTIRSAKSLALLMADRARPIGYTILKALQQDIDANADSVLINQYNAFRDTLIHDLTPKAFADIYAETIAYGLFAARYNDESTIDFTLQEAALKIPSTNPFLKQFFLEIAAYEKDERINWVLNNFVDLFRHADVHKIMSTYGVSTGMNHDPVTHFYETFLGEYDPKRRKARGVYYTPLPVVQYIVRAVDQVLKDEFGLSDGLADDSTISHTFKVDPYKKGKSKDAKVYLEETRQIPRVQILDPATGTSTFLNETIKLIAERKKHLGPAWSSYVEQNLLPRVHGFEILMAAYSMAHMRLGLTLAETGYVPSANAPRLGVYLTNTLEQPADEEPPLLAMLGMGRVLTEEAIQADRVKRDMPIMVVMGNPPYSVSSANKGKFIDGLMTDYKKDLNERNIQPLSDDYIKFIRYAESMIEKTGQGVVAMITNNSYIDGLIHRQMRKHLLQTFDKVYVLDLHGNAKKKETAPDGGKDENVFDIMQGVSIVIMVKKGAKPASQLGTLHFAELYGKRQSKYEALSQPGKFEQIQATNPSWYFVKKNLNKHSEYKDYINVGILFSKLNNGVETGKDGFFYSFSEEEAHVKLDRWLVDKDSIIKDYDISDSESYKLESQIRLTSAPDTNKITGVLYRPFDTRFCYYDQNIQRRPAFSTMTHMLSPNLGLAIPRQVLDNFRNILVTNLPADSNVLAVAKKYGTGPFMPLYIYNPDNSRTPNFDKTQLDALFRNMSYTLEDLHGDAILDGPEDLVTPEDVLDYIYGVLHSPSYREKYREFLKIDFPRVPAPKDRAEFDRYKHFGTKLRQLHLMQNVEVDPYLCSYEGQGKGVVGKLRYELTDGGYKTSDLNGNVLIESKVGRLYINDTQYFSGVPEIAWNFYIGGYQPAQKWLKDRKGRELTYKDIEHYQKIITILVETARLMKEIG